MAKAADQFRASDVTVWGAVALVSWAAAIFLANVSGLVPASALAALHSSRLESATVNQVRQQLAELKVETDRMRRENNLLLRRFDLAEQTRADATRRIAALESSLPDLLEAIPERAAIDDSVTASVTDGKAVTFDADGGTVTVQHKPLIALQPGTPFEAAPVDPGSYQPPAGTFGVALGFPIAEEDAEAQWQSLLGRVGTLLIGLWPLIAETDEGGGRMLVAGPVPTQSQAAALCGRMDRVGIPCEAVPFAGDPLPMLN